MNYILMSIRTRYAALILSGKKTLEIRKTAPKGLREDCEITVLLYESKREGGRGVIVGSFVCRSIRLVTEAEVREVCRRACLNHDELLAYAERPQRIPGAGNSTPTPGGRVYAWSVENPVTFEKPLLLRDVGVSCPPQSWRKLRKNQIEMSEEKAMSETMFNLGICKCCGQSRTLSRPVTTRQDADERATQECTCIEGKTVRGQMEERRVLQEIFPDVGEEVQDLLREVARMIREEQIYSGTSIKVAENVVAKFSLKKGVVSIVRDEKVEQSRSI
ncbi:MAG TPA: ASCH domain-containing protein [Candidatus Gemmiger excrementigallinarum]|uniref:ASCH domain-containing protein n=1 Tax=Candidatus Gemmiger excrementigallinarum TaxID=2838609 RepID=A0A9D2JAN0_9FIRM|nr:ASCH domain-containing protein [Candidatus Gemmiger excrementigallinarum]